MDKVTIVTVCYNAEQDILKTMRSVCEQDYPDMEYIIVDGASQDSTWSIIRRMQEEYQSKQGFEIRASSEKDKGIYDAMNKGIDIARGEWILFLNAGDLLYSPGTVSQVFCRTYDKDTVSVYGDTLRYAEDWSQKVDGSPLSDIAIGIPLPFCHQSVFVRTYVLKKIKFDLSYRLAGDYNFFVQCYLKNLHFEYISVIISCYAMGGVSETDTVSHLKEKIEIREQNGLEHYSTIKKWYMIYRLSLRQKVKKIIPDKVVKKIRGF